MARIKCKADLIITSKGLRTLTKKEQALMALEVEQRLNSLGLLRLELPPITVAVRFHIQGNTVL